MQGVVRIWSFRWVPAQPSRTDSLLCQIREAVHGNDVLRRREFMLKPGHSQPVVTPLKCDKVSVRCEAEVAGTENETGCVFLLAALVLAA